MYAQNYITTHFPGAKLRGGGDYWDARCLLHEDNRPSLSIDALTGRCTCHSCGHGSWLDEYAKAACLSEEPPPKPRKDGTQYVPTVTKTDDKTRDKKPAKKRTYSPTVAEYVYRTAAGDRHMMVRRTADKQFFQFRWNGMEWLSGISKTNHPRIPYNADKLAAAPPDRYILWVEGEKDADALTALGFLATTSPGGSKNSGKLDSWDAFKGRRIITLDDNDEPGLHYAKKVAQFLVDAEAKEVKTCRLPGQGPRLSKGGADVSDWLAGGGRTSEDLQAAIAEHAVDFTGPVTKPDIQVDWRDCRDVADEVVSHLLAGELYNRGGELVHLIRRNGTDAPRFKALDKDGLLAYMCRQMSFHSKVKSGAKPVNPPGWLSSLVLDSIELFPTVRRVTEFPYINKKGDLVTKEGLDDTGTYLLPLYPGLKMPSNPTAAQARESGAWLGKTFLGDFPFAEEYHRTHAILAMIQPFVMPFVDGQAPLYAVSATTMGTGKTRLCRVLGFVSSAAGPEMVTESQNPQHFETAAMSVLREAPPSFLIDNVKSNLDHVWLQGLLSAPSVNHRLMGTNTIIKVSSPSLWFVSANNPAWDHETRRRTCPIDLDPRVERPWARKPGDFKIQDIERFAQDERPTILHHVFTVLQYWRSQGRPLSDDFSGSFERWSRVMGGIAQVSGLEDFLKHTSDECADLDHEVLEWRALLEHWSAFKRVKGDWIPPKEVAGMALHIEVLVDLLGDKGAGAQSSAMGRALTRMKGRVFGDFRVLRQKGRKGWEYSVERLSSGDPDDGGGPPRGEIVPPRGPDADLADLLPTIGSQRSAPKNVGNKGIAAECRPCRPFPSIRAHAGEVHLPPDQNKVGKVGMVGKDERVGEIRGRISEKGFREIQKALVKRRSSYALRASGFGSANPPWATSVRPFIESGAWVPPDDLPWDATLATQPPPGWACKNVAPATSRASPPTEEKSLSECLDQILL